nr:creatininase family protein [Clostridium botulinum]
MEKITWKEILNLDKDKSVILVALSPIEEHEPHLPLGTDYIAAKDLLKATIDSLEKQNNLYNYIIHPSLPIGCNESIMNYPGTVSFKSETIENIIIDLGESISRAGFKKMVIVNHHLDLGHIKAIENAKDILNKGCSLKVLEVASRYVTSTANSIGEKGDVYESIINWSQSNNYKINGNPFEEYNVNYQTGLFNINIYYPIED